MDTKLVGKVRLIHLDCRHFVIYASDSRCEMLVSKMSATVFVILNLMDAYLTKAGLAMGASEVNPLMASIGGSMIAKGLIAVALVFILYWFRKERVLWPLNLILFGVILWNSAVYGILIFPKLDYVMISP